MGEQEPATERAEQQQQQHQEEERQEEVGQRKGLLLREEGCEGGGGGGAPPIPKDDGHIHHHNNGIPAPTSCAEEASGLIASGSAGNINNSNGKTRRVYVDESSTTTTTATTTTTTTTTTDSSMVLPPLCGNCNHRHPTKDNMGHFCTEGKQGFLESALAMATLGLVCGWCYMVVIVTGALLVHALVYKCVYTLGAFVYLISNFLWPVDNSCYPREKFVNCWLFTVWRRYFRWECVIEAQLDPNKRYLFAEMPHGVMPVGQFISCSIVREAFPGVKHIAGVAADVILRMPGIRSMYTLMGVRRAGRKSILEMFEDNINVAVVVGGIAEMFMVSRESETVYLKKRKNFTKIAVEAGADIVPVYFFGNTLLHDLVGGEGADNWLFRLSRKFKTALVIFYGRFGTPIPRRRRLKMVAGRPIPVVQSDHPSEAYVDHLHSELIRRVEEIYYKHRPSWETRQLIIT